jgi:Tfp pilus assembly protein PilF
MMEVAVRIVWILAVCAVAGCGRKEPPPGTVRVSDLSAAQLRTAGTRAFVNGEPALALKLLDKAVEKEPGNAEAHFVRSRVKDAGGDPTAARADLDKALELKPAFVEALHNRASLRARAGDLEGAIEDYAEAVELNPAFAPSWVGRARMRARKGDLAAAREDLEKAIAADPRSDSAFEERAKLELAEGRRDEALGDFRKAVEHDPAKRESSRLWIWALRALRGERKDADAELEAYLLARTLGKPGDAFSKTAGFLLGRVSEDAYLRGAPPPTDPIGRERRCEMLCFAGARQAVDGVPAKASAHFQAALRTEAHDCAAFHVARAELAAASR